MWDFHYSVIKKHFDSELLFTDTDNLTYEIKSEDVYEKFFKHKNLFDFSNISKDSKFYDNQSEMAVGRMKDEYKGIPINKFVVLKSKMHCMLSDDNKESNTAKIVNISIELKEYEETLLNKKIIRHKMKKVKTIKLAHMKSIKFHYHVLMIKICSRWWYSYTCLFSQRLRKIDSHKWS